MADPATCPQCCGVFVPKIGKQRYCSSQCGWLFRSSQRERNPDWLAGRKSEREIPCMDCGRTIVSRASRQACPECKAARTVTTNRRKNTKRRGAVVGVRYTLRELGERDGWRCHLCSGRVNPVLPGTAPKGPTVDHLIPLVDGGLDELQNVALAHRSCNVQRRDKGIVQLRLTG